MRLPVLPYLESQNSPGFTHSGHVSPDFADSCGVGITVNLQLLPGGGRIYALGGGSLSAVVRSRRWPFALSGGSLPAVVALGGGSLSVVVRSRRWPFTLGGGSLPAVVRSRWWFARGGGSLSAVVHSIGDGASPQETETEPGVFGWYGWYR